MLLGLDNDSNISVSNFTRLIRGGADKLLLYTFNDCIKSPGTFDFNFIAIKKNVWVPEIIIVA